MTTSTAVAGLTYIPVLHRDASNRKVWGQIALRGIITAEQIATLRDCLSDNSFYVPAQLGLRHLAPKAPNNPGCGDNNWHEMFTEAIITAAVRHTPPSRGSSPSTEYAGTVDEFITRLQRAALAGWRPELDHP